MKITNHNLTLPVFFLVVMAFFACSNESDPEPQADGMDTVSTGSAAAAPAACSTCKYIIPATATVVDGAALGIKPGERVCFSTGTKYTNSITFTNIIGTVDKPIIISNCDGTAVLTVSGRPFNFKTSNSKYFRITGGDANGVYGIRMSGSTSNGMVLTELSTNFEVDHVEIFNVGFAGLMAKTDPSCDKPYNRGQFTMREISIHHNYIHNTGGEGFYIGHSFFEGYELSCGVKLPHTIEGARIHHNILKATAWDGLQVSCATKDAEIYGNTIDNFGTAAKADQNYGIILGGGTAGRCYGNIVKGGTGTSLVAFGFGDNIIYNNVLINSAKTGIFCDERTTTWGAGYKVINNTVINPKEVGIRIYAEKVPNNIVMNNIVVNPGQYATYGNSAFIMKLNTMSNVVNTNNYTTRTIGDVKFVNPSASNYRLVAGSPAIDQGAAVTSYGISTDFYGGAREKGAAVDIGASEY
jgi:hypothetical protein